MSARGVGRPAGHYTQAARVRRVEALLWSRERIGLDEIARGLNTTTRTARRDLDALREAGVDVVVKDNHASLSPSAVRELAQVVTARAAMLDGGEVQHG